MKDGEGGGGEEREPGGKVHHKPFLKDLSCVKFRISAPKSFMWFLYIYLPV